MRLVYIILLVVFCTSNLDLLSQETPDSIWLINVKPVTVRATRTSIFDISSPLNVNTKNLISLNRANPGLAADEIIRDVPGVFALNATNFAQDLRISIRGFGARASFGIRGIKVFVDGIPSTTPDGQTQLDDLDLESVSNVEIIRGPGSGLYGNAAGGIIDLRTGRSDSTSRLFSVKTGSHGFIKTGIRLNQVRKKNTYLFNASGTSINGYRDQSGMKSVMLRGGVIHEFEKGTLEIRMNYTGSPKADDPGGLLLGEVETDRKQARDRNIQFNTGENLNQGAGSLLYHQVLSDKNTLHLKTYFVRRDFENKLPFEFGGQVSFDRLFGGGGVQFLHKVNNYQLLAGLDVESQRDNRKRHQNLNGTRGDKTFDQIESFNSAGLYLAQNISFSKRWMLMVNTRFDLLGTKANDRYFDNGDQSGKIDWNHFSPNIGLSYQVSPLQYLYINWGNSFETPTLSELSSNPSGDEGFNPDLKPQEAYHYEAGWKGILYAKWKYEIAFFYIDLKNEILPFELEDFPDREFYKNTGDSERKGLEVQIVGALSKSLSVRSSYSLSRFQFGSGEFDKKRLPGIPQNQFFISGHYRSRDGLYGSLNFFAVGRLFADNANMTKVKPYSLMHVRGGKEWILKSVKLNVFAGIRNLMGTRYFDNIRINAFGGRYYEPAPGLQGHIGVEVGW